MKINRIRMLETNCHKTLVKVISIMLMCILLNNTVALASSQTLNKPIPLNSSAGIKLFIESKHKESYWQLQQYFTTEKGLAWCAIASDVMALNALGMRPQISAAHYPYKLFIQSEFFSNQDALEIRSPAQVSAYGVTLEQNAQLLRAWGAKVKHVLANKSSIAQFRNQAKNAVSGKQTIILVNFYRQYIGEQGGGHFSPLAAYNQSTDQFLLLDVARYKYPPVWVSTKKLFKAMSEGIDTQSKKHRGYLLVRRR